MNDFESWWDWIRFQESVCHHSRYVHASKAGEFLQVLVATSDSRQKVIDARTILWRAQIGHAVEDRDLGDGMVVVEDPVPYMSDRMKPLPRSAHEGRANPKGIPCLYLATHKKTAMAEVRPWVDGLISLGQFETVRSLKIIDFSNEDESVLRLYKTEPDSDVRQNIIWAMIGQSFSRPVTNAPSTAEYVPTQIVAETFRQKGFDGIRYRSFLGDGLNIALFDPDMATLTDCGLQEVLSVSFKFKKVPRRSLSRT